MTFAEPRTSTLSSLDSTVETAFDDGHAAVPMEEAAWRGVPRARRQDTKAFATRWRCSEAQTGELHHETPRDQHLVMVVMNTANIRFSVGGATIHDGVAMPGMFHVAAPGVKVSCLFRGPCDVLHLHVPNGLIEQYDGAAPNRSAATFAKTGLRKDQMIERLSRALLAGDQVGGNLGTHYADCISMAIVVRLLTSAERAGPAERPKVAELARWRLKRAIEFVDANLGRSVSTADIAAATGLTRMHFAAQFKAATGLRPHEYLLRRRVERAQQMLVQTDMSVVDVALSVGFQSQSHFTVVFNRFVGRPPHAWRQTNDHGGAFVKPAAFKIPPARVRPAEYLASVAIG